VGVVIGLGKGGVGFRGRGLQGYTFVSYFRLRGDALSTVVLARVTVGTTTVAVSTTHALGKTTTTVLTTPEHLAARVVDLAEGGIITSTLVVLLIL
jgi:hypothetical protein